MRERILDGFNNGAVEFRAGAFHFECDLFTHTSRQIAHYPRKLAPHQADRLHAAFHHRFLQFGGDQVQTLGYRVERCVFLQGAMLQDLIAGEHQFPNQIH